MQLIKSPMINRRHRGQRFSVFVAIVYAVFTLLAIIAIYPFYNVIIISVANTVATARYVPYMYPHVLDWTAYKTIFNDSFFYSSLRNTVFITVFGTALSMMLSVTAAYVLSRKRLAGRGLLLSFILFTMLFSGGMIPGYLVVKQLRLLNTITAMIAPCLINTYYLIIMKNYFVSLPESLEEAARIDGANELTVLIRIFIPISSSFMATFALFYAVSYWNGWWEAYLFINQRSLMPLQIFLREVLVSISGKMAEQAQTMMLKQDKQKVLIQSIQMASIVVVVLPIICVYPFLQKYFVKGVMVGSIKE